MVRHVQERLCGRFRLVEIMPMELKRDDWTPSMLNQEESVDVFWRIAQAVYGKDIRRQKELAAVRWQAKGFKSV